MTANPFALDPAQLDTPAARQARAQGLLQVKRAAAQRAERLARLARPLLGALVSVSALHIFGQVARFAPAEVAALTLPAWSYHATAAALTLAVDLVALWLVAAGGALRLAGERPPRAALGYALGLTFLLNSAYMLAHAPALDGAARAAVLPWLDALFVVALPLFIPVALYAVEGAAQQLEAARLALLVEAAALRPSAESAQTEPAAPGWAGPVLVAAPAPSWARESYPAPVEVRTDAAPSMQRDAGLESMERPAAPAPQVCPNCGTELDRPRWLAARRWGWCAGCKSK